MATRDFRELAAQAKETWPDEAIVVYDAATGSYEAEVAALHYHLGVRPRKRRRSNEEDSQCPPTRS